MRGFRGSARRHRKKPLTLPVKIGYHVNENETILTRYPKDLMGKDAASRCFAVRNA